MDEIASVKVRSAKEEIVALARKLLIALWRMATTPMRPWRNFWEYHALI